MNDKLTNRTNTGKGIAALITAYLFWSFQAFYWKMLSDIPTTVLLANRIVWAVFILYPLIFISGRKEKLFRIFRNRKSLFLMSLSGFFILINWMVSIYAPIHNLVIEINLGRYTTPIITVLTGVILFKEPIKGRQTVSLILITAALFIMALHLGRFPMIAVLVSLSFVSYSAVKKYADLDSVSSITAELSILFIPALVYSILSFNTVMDSVNAFGVYKLYLVFGLGFFTAVPFFLYSYGLNHVQMSVDGYIKYFPPTIGVFLGVFIFNEEFSTIFMISMVIIWIAVINNVVYLLKKRP